MSIGAIIVIERDMSQAINRPQKAVPNWPSPSAMANHLPTRRAAKTVPTPISSQATR